MKRCGVLGATGTVGQKFVLLLADHPEFRLVRLGASAQSAGRRYGEAARWTQTVPVPADVAEMVVCACTAAAFADCEVVFSGLDHDAAGPIEEAFVASGISLLSNAKTYRREAHVPLVVPTVNSGHLDFIPQQLSASGRTRGFHVTNANCSTTGIVVPLAAIARLAPLDAVHVVTLQAVSGAGYPGVSALDMLDNVVPHIAGEEEKIEWETGKILGSCTPDGFVSAQVRISAACTRVPVLDGHLACVSVRFRPDRAKPPLDAIRHALEHYRCEAQDLGCFSAPQHPIHLFPAHQHDRPQPRLDRGLDRGYAVSVGRLRADPSEMFDIKYVCLSHNTILGAAGSSILNAELAFKKGYL